MDNSTSKYTFIPTKREVKIGAFFWAIVIGILVWWFTSGCGATFPNAKPNVQFNNCIVNQIEGKDKVEITCTDSNTDEKKDDGTSSSSSLIPK